MGNCKYITKTGRSVTIIVNIRDIIRYQLQSALFHLFDALVSLACTSKLTLETSIHGSVGGDPAETADASQYGAAVPTSYINMIAGNRTHVTGIVHRICSEHSIHFMEFAKSGLSREARFCAKWARAIASGYWFLLFVLLHFHKRLIITSTCLEQSHIRDCATAV